MCEPPWCTSTSGARRFCPPSYPNVSLGDRSQLVFAHAMGNRRTARAQKRSGKSLAHFDDHPVAPVIEFDRPAVWMRPLRDQTVGVDAIVARFGAGVRFGGLGRGAERRTAT